MAVKKNVQQNRKAFVQAKLGQTGVEATPEQRAKLRERFNTLSQTKEGRTKIAKALLPSGTAAERKALKSSIRPPQTSTGTTSTGTTSTGTTSTGTTGTGTTSTGSTTDTTKKVITYPGMGGNPKTTSVIGGVSVPAGNSATSTTVPRSTTSTTVPRSTTSTTVPQTTTTTTVKQSNAFKSTGPPSTSSNGKDLTVPIVGGILVTGAAAVGSKAFLSSGTNIDRLTRVRQNDLARQFKASQLTSSSSLTLADRPEFASVKDQRATAAAKAAAARPQFGSVADQRAAAAAKAAAARPQFGTVAEQRAKAGPIQPSKLRAGPAAGGTGGTRSVLEGMRSFMSGGLRKGAK